MQISSDEGKQLEIPQDSTAERRRVGVESEVKLMNKSNRVSNIEQDTEDETQREVTEIFGVKRRLESGCLAKSSLINQTDGVHLEALSVAALRRSMPR